MAKSYTITGPLHVAHKKPGDTVTSDELTDEAHLVKIGYITLTKSASTKEADSVVEVVVESTTDSTLESGTVSSQEKL